MYEITCICQHRSLKIEGEIKAAVEAGWVTGIRDQLLHPKEAGVYCCAECRDLDAAMVAHFRPSNYRGFVEMCGLDPDDLQAALSAVKTGKCKVKREGLLLHYITWLIDNPDENERGRKYQLAIDAEKRSCDGDMITWLVKRAKRLKQTEKALREGRTPCV